MNEEPKLAKEQYPYIDDDGRVWENLTCHYDPKGNKVICADTGEIYDKAIDLYPSKYTYYAYEEPEPEEEEKEE